jgi:hypothetical protein
MTKYEKIKTAITAICNSKHFYRIIFLIVILFSGVYLIFGDLTFESKFFKCSHQTKIPKLEKAAQLK